MTDYPISTIGKPSSQSNTVKWILEGVLPAMIREIRLDPDLWREIKMRVETEINLTS